MLISDSPHVINAHIKGDVCSIKYFTLSGFPSHIKAKVGIKPYTVFCRESLEDRKETKENLVNLVKG